ncbi:DUF6950 family protein [Pseudotabrizicola algicola]|uniref:DUF6950 domain-containing protein n=1 Tax=Pseudotabrizicola algicola TaxID=2709381 RepID=A0A6B3RGU2_9RHOB|nr:hypothetical protein [Pseudotabrizicola algicola]NEX45180.1 hypothetical protein [Pseudotabrizicola algicola]
MTPFDAALAAMEHPWRWGTHDCCASACSAFALLRGVDPMLPLRGCYASANEASELIEAWGGWESMTEILGAMAGLRPCAGGAGAIGLHRGGRSHSLVFGIGAGLWAGKSLRGMEVVKTVERAWI